MVFESSQNVVKMVWGLPWEIYDRCKIVVLPKLFSNCVHVIHGN